ncbi:hypothetical protein DP939_03850 [Spongiactinospora rosea]|uniref:Peptidase inhibitor family I36 n=1 Tax=Spongiactinospora rosea TaxID=2248750 RepID=A0A366M6J6_9ACTN|nr:hypothetical protein [Spongiactinospora rosea]RBQ21826.1 hypothetical protein DP939_03850 [Spongiactinospora rosea]
MAWARWQGITAIIGAVITLGGAGFFLYDRFAVPSEATPQPVSPGAVPQPDTHPQCAVGSICLWPQGKFGGNVWIWSPGKKSGDRLPVYLRDHVGSFDARIDGCFVDSERPERRPTYIGDWSEKYTDINRFGRRMDGIAPKC